jgi:hypothetical protein
MAQFVDNLARREAALPRRAGDKRVTAGPCGKVGERAGERRMFGRRGSGFRSRIVDRRDDPEDVNRHVDTAGNGRYLRRLHAAPVVVTVGEYDDRAAAAFTRADAFGRLSDGVVQRGGAKRNDRAHRVRQRFEAGRERLHFIEPGVEREHRRLVTALEPAQ